MAQERHGRERQHCRRSLAGVRGGKANTDPPTKAQSQQIAAASLLYRFQDSPWPVRSATKDPPRPIGKLAGESRFCGHGPQHGETPREMARSTLDSELHARSDSERQGLKAASCAPHGPPAGQMAARGSSRHAALGSRFTRRFETSRVHLVPVPVA
jgi:hypothetical protein